ncbi:MAG: hypothetical protein C6P37_04275 [Caldibacillus debilis]|uniref:Uncharacterized protein n=1 Tax=Caldibacillus debilis TaxID=301148 RepID=A0A3E0K6W3_9BACI|nr:MAG: hypothetical protein C6W56_12860 [Caldibacillus debilis]REJ30014.1 MAG: hypothetical protein C6P37_04275 [Caldibacillus debilis]
MNGKPDGPETSSGRLVPGFPDRITVSNPSLFRLAMRPTPAELLPGVKHILSDRTSNLRPNLGKYSSGLLSASSVVMTKSEQPDFPFPRRDGNGDAGSRRPSTGRTCSHVPISHPCLSFVRKTMRVWHPPPKPPARLSAIAKGR